MAAQTSLDLSLSEMFLMLRRSTTAIQAQIVVGRIIRQPAVLAFSRVGRRLPKARSDGDRSPILRNQNSAIKLRDRGCDSFIQTFELMKNFLDQRGVKYYAVEQPGYTHE